MKKIVLGILAACLGAVGFAAWRWTHAPLDIAVGQQLYARHCAECHGKNMEGQPDWQSRRSTGELPAPPHDPSGHTWHHADEQLFAVTKYGLAKFAPPDYKTNMPGFADKLSDQEIRAVLAYIKSTWPEDIRKRQQSVGAR